MVSILQINCLLLIQLHPPRDRGSLHKWFRQQQYANLTPWWGRSSSLIFSFRLMPFAPCYSVGLAARRWVSQVSAIAHLIVLIISTGWEPSFNTEKGLTSSKKKHQQTVIKPNKVYLDFFSSSTFKILDYGESWIAFIPLGVTFTLNTWARETETWCIEQQ